MSFSSVNFSEQLAIATKKQPVMSQQARQRAVSKLPVFRQEGFLARVSKLPAAVQRDIEAEGVTFIYNNSELGNCGAAGTYQRNNNVISLYGKGVNDIHSLRGQIALTHEIGHSLQYVKGKRGEPEIYKKHELQKVFDEEVAAFRQKYPNHKGIYAMTNPKEMFAEIYAMLNSEIVESSCGMYSPLMKRYQILKENFPKCIEVVKRHIEEIRNLDKAQRDNGWQNYDVGYDSTGNVVSMCNDGTSRQYIYDPIFPEILHSTRTEAKGYLEEVKYLSDDVVTTIIREFGNKKCCSTHSKKEDIESELYYIDDKLYGRSIRGGNASITCGLTPTGEVFVKVDIKGYEVFSGVVSNITQEDFLNGNINMKGLLQEYVEFYKDKEIPRLDIGINFHNQ